VYFRDLMKGGPDCKHGDFNNESPFFFMHPLNGPQARLATIRLLMKDQAFKQYFQNNRESLEAYEKFAEKKAKMGLL
jgi:hypothetical protein